MLEDKRDLVLARWNEIAYVGTLVIMPADLWRLAQQCSAAGWSNAKALKRAGAWER